MTVESQEKTVPSPIEALYAPHEEPNKHRIRANRDGDPARIVEGRRSSEIDIAHNLRGVLREWRESGYPGTSDTTRELLGHWFEREHRLTDKQGESHPFRYYYCQREATEAFIYLRECRAMLTLSQLIHDFGPGSDEERTLSALGVTPEEDRWPHYTFKLATGAGKTKVMSLAIVWSYFHALRESDSPMAKNFVVIAPNLPVYERLRDDFGNGRIFDTDPLIPPAWKGDFNLSVVLQDEASGASTGGVLYLTNIHRLYDPEKRAKNRNEEMYDWMGPAVSKAKALDMGQALRERITGHNKIMVINDEAHHVWDADSTWNQCLEFLHTTIQQKTGNELVAQLNFSATPKDNKGNLFKDIVCDTPLGEAIDAGIVKTPIIGQGNIKEISSDNAAERYQRHLMLGYNRWLESFEEWEQSGKKALMFVMTESAEAADAIAHELNTNTIFEKLNGKTINLHTRLKGKINKKTGQFVPTEKDIKNEDLEFLRKLSRELDSNASPYRCIVSVLMLREGWDVKNVTTIVPLRALTAKSQILPEQTLGRGLRRMTPPGQADEIVTVVEHPSFAHLYKQELAQQGVLIEVVDADKVPRTTVSIFPDAQNKDLEKLKLTIPRLTPGFTRTPKLEGLTFEDIQKEFSKYKPLPIGETGAAHLDYEGRHLITNEIIESLQIQLPLLSTPGGSVSFYRVELERTTKLTGTAHIIQPLLERFIQECLFEKPVNIYDSEILGRLAEDDVREHIRAVFVPLILTRTTIKEERLSTHESVDVTTWKPFQVSNTSSKPVLEARKTLFNLVPCTFQLEVAMTKFLDTAPDVVAFFKNTGPQALRIDYVGSNGHLGLYTPDFVARTPEGRHYLIETKGRIDRDVPIKARAAMEWCKSASSKKHPWEYVFVPEELFYGFSKPNLEDLIRTCLPQLKTLVDQSEVIQPRLPLEKVTAEAETASALEEFVPEKALETLPSLYKNSIEQAVTLFKFLENQENMSFSPVFTPLLRPLDSASQTLVINTLSPFVPKNPIEQKAFFDGSRTRYDQQARNLMKTVVYKSGFSQIGLLRFCLTFENREKLEGVFKTILEAFAPYRDSELVEMVDEVNNFRNTYIAHQEEVLTDVKQAKINLQYWIKTIVALYKLNYQ
ncbi:MAG: DEAD/DEAH box helicase [Oligoflexales bacterium]